LTATEITTLKSRGKKLRIFQCQTRGIST